MPCVPVGSAAVGNDTRTRTAVLDTSVVLKWYLHKDEPERARALALRQTYLDGWLRLLAPDLLLYEVANVLRYKPGWDASRVSQALDSLYALKLKFVSVSIVLVKRAVTLASDYDVAV